MFLAPARAHLLNMTRVNVVVEPASTFTLQVDVDLSVLLGDYRRYGELLEQPRSEQTPRLQELGRRVIAEIGLTVDGTPIELAPTSWTLPEAPPEKVGDQAIAAMTVFRYQGELPPNARELVVAPGGMAKVEFPLAYTFTVQSTNVSLTRWLELPGSSSRVLRLPSASVVATGGVTSETRRPDEAATSETGVPSRKQEELANVGATATTTPTTPASHVAEEDFTPFELATARVVATVIQHLRLGFRHIFPQGIDHVLFVLGLFFLGPRWRPLLSQTTAFTIAHTTTLGLASYGIVTLPARLVEPLIALSIAYVALENIWKPQLRPTRVAIVFLFGLLHGLGFASSLSEVPMPRDQFFTALLSFNLGVDFGQLAVIAAAFLLVGWFRNKSWYRKAIVIPACGAIAAIGLFWTVERTLF